MTALGSTLAVERRRRAMFALLVAGLLAILAYAVTALDLNRLKAPTAAGPVLPGFAQSAAAANAITIQTKDAAYHIVRSERGWTLRDRGDYPVQREKLGQFTSGLATLAYLRPMTRDPNKLDRLGLGDPAKGGEGVLVQVQNDQGALLANLVLGLTPTGLYMREPDKTQAWALQGEMPPLKDPAQWLDLAPLSIAPERIVDVLIAPVAGGSYRLIRANGAAPFALQSPYDRLAVRDPALVAAAGESFSRLQPMDVVDAPAIDSAAVAHVTMRTADGLTIAGELIDRGGRKWLKLIAQGEGAAAEEAQRINARAAAWAYGLSALDFETLAPPLATLTQPVQLPPPAAATGPSAAPAP
jgi:hypothetical protein